MDCATLCDKFLYIEAIRVNPPDSTGTLRHFWLNWRCLFGWATLSLSFDYRLVEALYLLPASLVEGAHLAVIKVKLYLSPVLTPVAIHAAKSDETGKPVIPFGLTGLIALFLG